MPLVRKKGKGKIVSPFWYYDFRLNGNRYRESTETTNKSEAALIEADARLQAEGGKLKPMRGRKAPLLRDFLTQYREAFEANQLLSFNTKRYYRNGIRLLLDTPLKDVRLDHLTRTIVAGVKIPGSGSNANNAIRTLRASLSFAVEMGLLRQAPELQLYEEKERQETYTPQQEATLLKHADGDTADAFILLIDSGLRPEECVRFEVDWIRWDLNLMRIINGKSKGYSRDVPMTERVREMWTRRLERLSLSKYKSHRLGKWGFPSKKLGKHITLETLRDGFNEAKRKANLPDDLVLYCTRHTFGTDMAELRNPKLTMITMGHRELKTTARYQHPETSAIAAFLDRRNAQRKSATAPRQDGHTFGHTHLAVN